MYSFIYTNKTSSEKDQYLLHITFDDEIIQSMFVQFTLGADQIELDNFANNVIDSIENFEVIEEGPVE